MGRERFVPGVDVIKNRHLDEGGIFLVLVFVGSGLNERVSGSRAMVGVGTETNMSAGTVLEMVVENRNVVGGIGVVNHMRRSVWEQRNEAAAKLIHYVAMAHLCRKMQA